MHLIRFNDFKIGFLQVPVDLVIDHSVQVDVARSENAVQANMELEFQRNKERFGFLKWGSNAFNNMLVVPPGSGIVHQVIESFGKNGDVYVCVWIQHIIFYLILLYSISECFYFYKKYFLSLVIPACLPNQVL